MHEKEVVHEGPNLPEIIIDRNNSPLLNKIISEVVAECEKLKDENEILAVSFALVSGHFKHTRVGEVDRLVPRNDLRTISLDMFLENEAGTCVQTTHTLKQVLIELHNIGLLKNLGKLKSFNGDRYGHVWYEQSVDNKVICIDIVNNFIGDKQTYDNEILNDLIENAFY